MSSSSTSTTMEGVTSTSSLRAVKNDRGAFVWLLVSIFFVVVLIKTLHHSMWRDELQAWMIAVQSHSISELFHNTRYEGHPSLWFLILYGLSRFTTSPVIMQVAHVFAATGVIALVAVYAPFSRVQKILFSLGYFPFFEYASVSRNYVLGVLLFFAACALFCHRRYALMAGALFLLCQTSAYGAVLAIAFGCAIFFDGVISRWLASGSAPTISARSSVAATVIVALGAILSAVQMLPPKDSGIAPTSVHSKSEWYVRYERVVSDVVTGYVPARVPDAVMPLKLSDDGIRHVKFAISVPLLLLAGWMLWGRPTAFILFLAGTIGQLLFKLMLHSGGFRHHGHFVILFIGAYWIWFASSSRDPDNDLLRRPSLIDRLRRPLFTLLLIDNAAIGLAASALDWFKPFSAGYETAKFIEEKYSKDIFIVADKDLFTSTVAGYLGRPVYYACRDDYGSYIVWNDRRRMYATPEELVAAVETMRREQGADKKALLVLTYELPSNIAGAALLGKFHHSIRFEERYWVYEAMSGFRLMAPTTSTARPIENEPEP